MRHDEGSGAERRVPRSPARAARAAGPSAAGRTPSSPPTPRRVPGLGGGEPAGAIGRDPGPIPGRQPTSRRPRPFAPAGTSIIPEPWRGVQAEQQRQVRQRGAPRRRRARRDPSRSPQTTITLSAPVSRAATSRRSLRVDARPAPRAGRAVGWPGTRPARRGRERASPSSPAAVLSRRRSAAAGLGAVLGLEQRLLERRAAAPRRRRARSAAPRWRRRRARSARWTRPPARAEAPHGLSQAQVEDRRLVERVALQHQRRRRRGRCPARPPRGRDARAPATVGAIRRRPRVDVADPRPRERCAGGDSPPRSWPTRRPAPHAPLPPCAARRPPRSSACSQVAGRSCRRPARAAA